MSNIAEYIGVELVDFMGSDLMVVNAARVSFQKEAVELGEGDKNLIAYLAKHKHTTPFRHPQLHLWCKAPIFLARQLGKHQVGFSWNEVSRRYINGRPEFYTPTCWRKRPEEGIKQGSSQECVPQLAPHESNIHPSHASTYSPSVTEEYEALLTEACHLYERMLEAGVAPEMARMALPQSMITEWRWTGSLYGFFQVYKQRIDAHAQAEARYFAEELDAVIPRALRNSWEELKFYDV